MVFDNNNELLSVTVDRLSGSESPKSGRTIQPTNQPTNFLLNMASPICIGSFFMLYGPFESKTNYVSSIQSVPHL
jgi:hypothetical protein